MFSSPGFQDRQADSNVHFQALAESRSVAGASRSEAFSFAEVSLYFYTAIGLAAPC